MNFFRREKAYTPSQSKRIEYDHCLNGKKVLTGKELARKRKLSLGERF